MGYPPAISPFFDTFYLFVNPVYASMYFPGTALLTVPSIWRICLLDNTADLRGAWRAAFFFSITAELFGGFFAIVARDSIHHAPLCSPRIPHAAPGNPVMLAILVLLWAWLRWRRSSTISAGPH